MDNVLLESKQYVVFTLSNAEYGIETKKIAEIVKMMQIARVPKAPIFVKGVINLRGEIVPVIDLRARFNLPSFVESEETRIIIMKVEEIELGLIVDSVKEVINFEIDAIDNVTTLNNNLIDDYIEGIGKIDRKIVTLLNLENLIKKQN